MNTEKNTMAVSTTSICGLRKVPGFDPLRFAKETLDQAGEKVLTLDLEHKKNWFRLACPSGGLVLNPLRVTDTMAIFEARVFADKGDRNPLASCTTTKAADKATGQRYINEAQDTALNKALENAGFDIRLYDLMKSVGSHSEGTEAPSQSEAEPAPIAQTDVPPAGEPHTEGTVQTAPASPPEVKGDVQAEKKAAAPATANNDRPAPAATQPHSDRPAPVSPPPHSNQPAPVTPQPRGTSTPAKESAPASVVDIATRLPVNAERPAPDAQGQAKPEFQHVTESTAQPTADHEELPAGVPSEPVEAAQITYTADMTVAEICKHMTLEQALSQKVPSGICAGWTLEQVAKDRATNLRYYQFASPFADNILKAASKLVLEDLEQKMAG